MDLEGNADFIADLLSDMTRNSIVEKWNTSAGYVSSRRDAIRRGNLQLPTAPDPEAPPETTEITTNDDGTKKFTMTRNGHVDLEDARKLVRSTGDDPDLYNYAIRTIAYGAGQWSNKISVWPKSIKTEPDWPPIQPVRDRVIVRSKPVAAPLVGTFQTAVIGADPQGGFDMDADGSLVAYHDDRAIDIFLQIIGAERPKQAIIAGDIFDLAEQGRWAQEERFARTTQHALEWGRELAAAMREFTPGEIAWIEGNHDKRMQGFMEANAKASMGLKRAGYPDSWPVMSIPNLVGLDEFNIKYVDAYPAGIHWITDGLRVIHGTKANSKGSTASQYANEMPHISTVFGHTHRLEVQSKTTFDRAGKIRTMNVNPGCLCRVDGTVPSVHGARHLNGDKATYWEDWQQGVAVIRYRDDGKFYVELVQIDDGVGMHGGQELVAQ